MPVGHGNGPIPSRLMIVGEAWGENEEREHQPFVGASGAELNRMLQEAGILRSEAYVTNLVNARPPNNDLTLWVAKTKKAPSREFIQLRDKWVLPIVKEGYQSLMAEIAMVRPNVIVAVGNAALWALTGLWGITKWRGSMLKMDGELVAGGPPKVLPTYHPAAVLRQWEWRAIAMNDLRRVAKELNSREYAARPERYFQIRPSFQQVLETLQMLQNHLQLGEVWLDLDIETTSKHIACIGVSWHKSAALCIPLMCKGNREGYWTPDEEATIVYQLYRLFTHKNARVRWQNGLYDAQYIWKHWHFLPRGAQDTMISQHALFADLPKSLAFQASMYAEHYVFWKDEGKQLAKGGTEEQHWQYNLLDCVYTREVGEAELATVEKLGLQEPHKFQQQMFWPVLQAMRRGVLINAKRREELALEVQEQIQHRFDFIQYVVGHPINIGSPKQMQAFFYEDMQEPIVWKRDPATKRMRPTCDDDALTKISRRNILLKPICNAIADIRTLEKYMDVILMKLDEDGRARCSYNIGGSESGKSAPRTYRLSSSKSAFGSGANLQNISSEKSKSVGKAAARGHIAMLGDPYQYPNIRTLFGPDPGFEFFDRDLDRADLHVFVWEIEDETYKELLRRKVDAHLFHVYLLDGKEPPPMEELIETHPKYWEHRTPRKLKREFSKIFCHATDYVASSKTLAQHTGWLVHEVDRAKKRYLGVHPRIEPYWKEVETQMIKRRYIENKFGYRWYIFDRVEGLLPEAVAWIPQSTVGITINKIWHNIYQNAPEVQVLLQVHDSLAGQYPKHRREHNLKLIEDNASIVIPYSDPLIIPGSIGTSDQSWGDC